MIGQELKILFIHDKAFLTSDYSLSFNQLGLPEGIRFFRLPAFWKVKVLNYKEDEKKLNCEILTYKVGETVFENNQQLLANKLKEIQTIVFRNIDTRGLLVTLKGNNKAEIRPSKDIYVDRTFEHFQSKPIVSSPIRRTINQTFFVPLKNVQFKNGGVSFEKKFKEYRKILKFTIQNETIKEEFDAVKNYFSNVLNSKKIQVTVNVEIIGDEITLLEVSSPEINRINNHFIDNVKFGVIKTFGKRKSTIETEKNLFTMEETFETFTDNKIKSKAFYNKDSEFLDDLLAISNTKHYKHLRFLSSKHSHDIMKLRFVFKPFSFIFLIQGSQNYYIIWETLDTEEATYVWHIKKDINELKMTLQKIESIINVMKVQGKTNYISSREDNFRRIYHDYSNQVEGFLKWKGELESILI